MNTKQEFIDFILNDTNFKNSLVTLDDKEKSDAINFAIDLGTQLAEAFLPVVKEIESNPEFVDKLREELNKS